MTEMLVEPLLDALARVEETYTADRWFEGDACAPDIRESMFHLAAVVTAIHELGERGEDANPEAVREEIIRLDEGTFGFDSGLPVALETGFREDGDDANANTLANAYSWWDELSAQE
jgi:hypothetical protein